MQSSSATSRCNPMKRVAQILVLVFLPLTVLGQRGFQLIHTTDQIKIYRPVLEDGYITYDASLTLNSTSVGDVKKVLQNFEAHPQWMYRIMESRKLEDNGKRILLYQVSRSNWPFKNRDYILQVDVLQDDTERYRLRFTARPKFRPENPKYVRIQTFTGEWDVVREGNKVRIGMFTSFRPEVNFPKTFFRTLSKRIPLATFKNLRERLQP